MFKSARNTWGILVRHRFYSAVAANGGSNSNSSLVLAASKNVPYRTVPLRLDTWHWREQLQLKDPNLSDDQAEALLTVVQRIAAYRLHAWHEQIVPVSKLQHDMHQLQTMLSDIDRHQAAVAVRMDNEQRARMDRIMGELHAATDQMREMTMSTRTDLSLLVNSFKAESRENAQNQEIELHKVEGLLANVLGTFRSEYEHVKARVIYTFLFMVALIVSAAISARNGKDRPDGSPKEKFLLVDTNLEPIDNFFLEDHDNRPDNEE